jgi:hypothetical protein
MLAGGEQLHPFTNTTEYESGSGFDIVGSFHGSMPT